MQVIDVGSGSCMVPKAAAWTAHRPFPSPNPAPDPAPDPIPDPDPDPSPVDDPDNEAAPRCEPFLRQVPFGVASGPPSMI